MQQVAVALHLPVERQQRFVPVTVAQLLFQKLALQVLR
jgi:hypothetical protein